MTVYAVIFDLYGDDSLTAIFSQRWMAEEFVEGRGREKYRIEAWVVMTEVPPNTEAMAYG